MVEEGVRVPVSIDVTLLDANLDTTDARSRAYRERHRRPHLACSTFDTAFLRALGIADLSGPAKP